LRCRSSFRRLHCVFVVFAEWTIAAEPSEGALHDPSEARDLAGALPSFDDLQFPAVVAQDLTSQLAAFLSSVSNDRADEGPVTTVSATAIPTALSNLAAKLTEPEDRETYAALISYFNSLPKQDEMFRLVELLGPLTLAGQHIPDAIAELWGALRTQSNAASEYYRQVDGRLASLPEEIAAGVDSNAIAKGMAESFRQQLAVTGLETTANLLRNSSREITLLSGQISATLKPAAQEYQGVSATISRELARLTMASDELRRHNAQLMADERSNNWWVQGFMMLAILLAGIVAGVYVEKGQTTDALVNLGTEWSAFRRPCRLRSWRPRRRRAGNKTVIDDHHCRFTT